MLLCSVSAVAVLPVSRRDGETCRCLLNSVVVILAGIGSVILQPLENGVDGKGEKRAQEGPNPVDPLVTREVGDDGRAKRSRWVDASSGEVCAADVGDEDGEANAQGRQERGSVLFHGKEVDGDDELRCEEHFDKEAAGDAGAGSKLVGYKQRTGQQGISDCCGSNSGDDLSGKDKETTHRLDCADKNEAECDLVAGISTNTREYCMMRDSTLTAGLNMPPVTL